MPNLADSTMNLKFRAALDKCKSNAHRLSDWETGFIASIAEQLDNREKMLDMGISPWNPSSNQWNTLLGIAQGL